MKRDLFILITLLVHFAGFSQSSNTAYLPSVIPPAPNAAALGKYGDIPVSYYTGLVNTSIPVYTITDRDISVPISLSYHHGGVRVEEEASWVGLGWTLNAGGAITRTIRGRDDFHPQYGYAFNPSVNDYYNDPLGNSNFTSKTQNMLNPDLDTEPDLFYYNVGGKSGKFIMAAALGNTFPISGIPLEKSDIQIRCVSRTGSTRDFYKYVWEIVTEEGFKYTFSEQEINATMGGSGTSPQSVENGAEPSLNYSSDKAHNITAWYLTSIFSPNTNTTVTFNYYRNGRYFSAGRVTAYEKYYESQAKLSDNTSDPNCTTQEGMPSMSSGTSVSLNVSRNVYLKSIEFNQGKVEFLMTAREDIQRMSVGQGDIANLPFSNTGMLPASVDDDMPKESLTILDPLKLTYIDVLDKAGARVKRWEFIHSYFNSSVTASFPSTPSRAQNMTKFNNLRLRLDAFKEWDKNLLTALPPHRFFYEGDVLNGSGDLVTPVTLPSKTSCAKDYWGYYNGQTINNTKNTMIPAIAFPQLTGRKVGPGVFDFVLVGMGNLYDTGVNREADENAKKLGALSKIKYPTGGNTSFDYESNKAYGGLGLVETTIHEATLSNPNINFLVSQSDTYADIIFELNCEGSTSAACQNPATSGTSGASDWYAKILKDNAAFRSENYTKWLDKTCAMEGSVYRCRFSSKELGIKLAQGNYNLQVQKLVSAFPTPKIKVILYRYNISGNFKEVLTGGLRIKTISDYNGSDSVKTTSFDYTKRDGSGSSGIQMRDQMLYNTGYLEMLALLDQQGHAVSYPCRNLKWAILIESASLAPLGTSAGGNHVGYTEVTVTQKGKNDNGRIEYTYKNIKEVTPPTNLFMSIPTKANGSNGMLLKERYYNANNFVVREVVNDEPVTKTNISQLFKGMKFYIGNLQNSSLLHVTKVVYDIPSDFWYQPKTLERVYDLSDPSNSRYVETEASKYFDGNGHLQPTKTITKDSRGRAIQTTLRYPNEMVSQGRDPNGVYSAMLTNRIINPVVEQITLLDTMQTGLKQTNYKKWNNLFFAPETVKTQMRKTDELVTRVTFTNYTANGQPQAYTELNGISTVLDWWDTYDASKKGLIKSKTVGTGPISQTSTYDHYPLIGLKSTTEPNGLSTFYFYDGFGRLQSIKDNNQNVVKSYNYNLAGQ